MTVMTTNRDALTFYATSGPFTDLSAHGARVRELPRTLPELCQVVQGLPTGQRGPGALRHPRQAWPLVRAAEPRS